MAYYVYIMTNQKNGTLYIGVTNDLIRRVYEHKTKVVKGFTQDYDLTRLVYYEIFEDAITAIQREKTMKHYVRQWKINLIQGMNSEWNDLYEALAAA